MITDVSLRLLYLFFDLLFSWLVLLGRTSLSKDTEASIRGRTTSGSGV